MSSLRLGFWGIADETLQRVGRGAAWLVARRGGKVGERAAYAIIGGALLCAVFGGVTGFVISDVSLRFATEGAIIGGLLGACMGVLFGSFVETVDDNIRQVLGSLKPK